MLRGMCRCLVCHSKRKDKTRRQIPSRERSDLDILSDGDFVGKDSIAGQSSRTASASAMTDCGLLRIERKAMMLALTRQVKLANMFRACVLARNILSGHPKTGQRWSGQNRPTGRGRDSVVL